MLTAAVFWCAVLPGQAAQPRQYKGELGKFYLIGTVGHMPGTGEKIENGSSRLVAIKGVRTALAFGTQKETYVAGEGRMLFLIDAAIKNAEKSPILTSDSRSFSIRMFESGMKQGDFAYHTTVRPDMGPMQSGLKNGESMDVVLVFEFPSPIAKVRFSPYFSKAFGTDPNFDLTDKVGKSSSVFARDSLTFARTAIVAKGKKFDLDALEFVVKGVEKTADKGYKVVVEMTNPMLLAVKWGWQYAKASVKDAKGTETAYYPDFKVTSAGTWQGEVPPGKTVAGEYIFYPADGAAPTSFALQMNSTKRAVTVTGL